MLRCMAEVFSLPGFAMHNVELELALCSLVVWFELVVWHRDDLQFLLLGFF